MSCQTDHTYTQTLIQTWIVNYCRRSRTRLLYYSIIIYTHTSTHSFIQWIILRYNSDIFGIFRVFSVRTWILRYYTCYNTKKTSKELFCDLKIKIQLIISYFFNATFSQRNVVINYRIIQRRVHLRNQTPIKYKINYNILKLKIKLVS